MSQVSSQSRRLLLLLPFLSCHGGNYLTSGVTYFRRCEMDESHVPRRHRTPGPSLVLLLFFNTRIMDTNRLTIFFKYILHSTIVTRESKTRQIYDGHKKNPNPSPHHTRPSSPSFFTVLLIFRSVINVMNNCQNKHKFSKRLLICC